MFLVTIQIAFSAILGALPDNSKPKVPILSSALACRPLIPDQSEYLTILEFGTFRLQHHRSWNERIFLRLG